MELQHLDIKLYLAEPAGLDLEAFIGVFQRWIQVQADDDLLFDVADYRHLPGGPGVMLVGHGADLALDSSDGRLGLRRRQKVGLSGDAHALLTACMGALWRAAERLEAEPSLAGLRFDYTTVAVRVNDRMLAPNTAETRGKLTEALRGFFGEAAGKTMRFKEDQDPRHIAAVHVHAPQALRPGQSA